MAQGRGRSREGVGESVSEESRKCKRTKLNTWMRSGSELDLMVYSPNSDDL